MGENSDEVKRLRDAVTDAERAFDDLVDKKGEISGEDLDAASDAHQAVADAKEAVSEFLRERDHAKD